MSFLLNRYLQTSTLQPGATTAFADLEAPCQIKGRSRDSLYEPIIADSEREAVADLLQYLENVRLLPPLLSGAGVVAFMLTCAFPV